MEFYNSRAIYLQIADHIIRQILMQERKAGNRLPSVRELASEIEVNPNTIAKTYTWLAEQSIIKMQRGIGYFITDAAYDQAVSIRKSELLEIDLPKIIDKANLLGLSLENLLKEYEHETEK